MNRQIFLTLYAILFIGAFSMGMVVPLLSGYAHALGGTPFSIGIVFGIASICMMACHPMVGRLSDQKGRKPFIALGLFIGVFTSLGFMAANSILLLIGVRACQGMGGSMVGPVSQAYAGQMTQKGREAFAMGSLNTAGWVGFGLGPVCAGVIKDGWGMDAAFATRSVLCLAGLCICLFFLPSDPPASEGDDAQPIPQETGMFARLLLDKALMHVFLLRIALYMCIGVFWAFCPLVGETELGMSGMEIGMIITMGTFAGALCLPLAGKLADKIDKPKLCALGSLLLVSAMILFAFVRAGADFYLISLCIGLGSAVILPCLIAIAVISGKKQASMGRVVSLMAAGDNLGMMLGPMLCGGLISLVGNRAAFLATAVIMAGAGLNFLLSGHGAYTQNVKGHAGK
ncbi:MAG: MFS transporter [Desulfobacterales bacterium]|nr:MFS transporter [Desulfobacterales bacterium]